MPTALITGASTGIGRATALRLAASGWTVLAGVRKTADGEALRADGGERVIPLELDVTDAAQIARAASEWASSRRAVWTRSSTTPAVPSAGRWS